MGWFFGIFGCLTDPPFKGRHEAVQLPQGPLTKKRKCRKGSMQGGATVTVHRRKTKKPGPWLQPGVFKKKIFSLFQKKGRLWGDCQRCCWEARSGVPQDFENGFFRLWNIVLSVNDYIAHRTDGTGMSTSTFTIKIDHVGEYTSPMNPSCSCLVPKRHVLRVEAFFWIAEQSVFCKARNQW